MKRNIQAEATMNLEKEENGQKIKISFILSEKGKV